MRRRIVFREQRKCMERGARVGFGAGSQRSNRQTLFGLGLSAHSAHEHPGLVLADTLGF